MLSGRNALSFFRYLILGYFIVGCSLALDFDDECTESSDCDAGLGCSQGLCVAMVTNECPTLHGVDGLSSNTILFGVLLPYSGALAQYGPPMEQAVRLAVDEINGAGGIFGRRIAVLSCDSESDASEAAERISHMRAFGIPAVIGAASSAVTLGAFTNAAKEAGMLMISPASTSPLITNLPDDGLLWRTVPSDATQGLVIGEYILEQSFERVAIISIDDAYGNGLRDTIVARICASGSGFVCDSQHFVSRTYSADTYSSDHQSTLTSMSEADFVPDVTVLIAFPAQGEDYILAANDPNARYLLADGMKTPELFCAVPDSILCQALGTAPAAPSGADYASFDIRFRAKFGGEPPGTYTAQSYDALYLLAYAFAATGAEHPTGAEVATGLAQLSAGESVPAGVSMFSAAIQTLSASGQTIDYRGASGDLNFDSSTGEALASIEAWYFNTSSRQIDSLGEVMDRNRAVQTSVFNSLPSCPATQADVCQ